MSYNTTHVNSVIFMIVIDHFLGYPHMSLLLRILTGKQHFQTKLQYAHKKKKKKKKESQRFESLYIKISFLGCTDDLTDFGLVLDFQNKPSFVMFSFGIFPFQ